MNAFRIPKQRVIIDVSWLDGSEARLAVFLAETAPNHEGTERLSDLLSGWTEFIPAQDIAADRMTWINRANVALVRAGAHLDPDETEYTIPTEEEVSVFLSNGTEVRGLMTFVRPPYESRLTDVLNGPHHFLRLVEGAQVTFINKRYIVRVVSHKEQ